MDRIAVLRAFVRLVDKGSFTEVAQELRVKQSTVSKWLAGLEQDLGVRLLDRTTRSLRVTDTGQRFYQHALGIVAAYDEAISDLHQGGTHVHGRIRMSLPVVFGRLFIVPLMAKFLRQHPQLELDMMFNDRYVSLVEEGYDLAVRVGIPVDSSLRLHALGGSRRCLVASPGYLRSHGLPATPHDLAKHECIALSSVSPRARWTFSNAERTQRVTVRGRVRVDNSEAALALARAGTGICLLASWLVDPDIRAGRLVHLLPAYEAPFAPVQALTAPGGRVKPGVRRVIEHLRAGLEQRTPPATTAITGPYGV